MARYIDAEKCPEYFDKEYKELRQQVYQGEIVHSIEAGFVGAERAIHKIPTADVVPKSEVAREIFEKIEREIVAALRSNYNAKQERVEKQIPDDFVSYMCEGKIAALRGIDDFIAELKKKYTEGE